LLEKRGERERASITIVSPDPSGLHLGDSDINLVLRNALDAHRIEFLHDFPIDRVTPGKVIASDGRDINFDLLMLLPPFQGSPAASYLGITDDESYINVDSTMRVIGLERVYAIGDCVDFGGPKMGHMAVRQGEVAAANLAAEIDGYEPVSHYVHEMSLVIDEGGSDSIYVHKGLWDDEPANVRQGRFWSWAKRVQEKYWEASHS
jgi:sulfide:quinone oxidoreductase